MSVAGGWNCEQTLSEKDANKCKQRFNGKYSPVFCILLCFFAFIGEANLKQNYDQKIRVETRGS